MIVGLWMTRFLYDGIGGSAMGWWTQAMALVGYLAIIDMGLSSLLPRAVASCTGESGGWQNASGLPKVIAQWAKFSLLQLPVAILLALLNLFYLVRSNEGVMLTSAVLMTAATLIYPLRIGASTLTGVQDFKFLGLLQLVSYFMGIGVTIFSVTGELGILSPALGWLTQSVLYHGVVWIRLCTRYRSILPTIGSVMAAHVPFSLVLSSVWAWLALVGSGFAGTAEIIAVGWNETQSVVFQYACSTKLVAVFFPLVISFSTAVIPGLAELRATKNKNQLAEASLAYTQVVLLISGVAGCIVLSLNAVFVGWWVGEKQYLGSVVTIISVIAMNLRHLMNSLAVNMFCLGREKRMWQLAFIEGCLAVVATFFAVGYIGTWAAPLGPLISLVICLPVAASFVRVEFTQSNAHYLKTILRWVIAYVAVGCCSHFFGLAIHSTSFLALAGASILIVGIYSVSMIWVVKGTPLAKYTQQVATRLWGSNNARG